jgi:superoxide dismutase, Cu-Zn family
MGDAMKKILVISAASAALASTLAIVPAQSPSFAAAATALRSATPAAAPDAAARLIGMDGQPAGVVLFHQTPAGVQIDINASHLPPGVHGIHIHAVGKCEAPGFKTAGAHFDVGGHAHGRLDPHGPHTGDMANQTAGKLGFLRATVIDPSVTLGPGPTSLFDADGSSIVIHAGSDDYKSQPAGNSGDRIACGVIKTM